MSRIVITISYDGSDFIGWQIQKKGRSVQGEIQKALSAVLNTDYVKLTGSGRTDSGVHATGQVAHFDTETDSIPPEKIKYALNKLLPPDIRILDSRSAPYPEFHSRYDARKRVYQYHIFNQDIAPAHLRLFSWQTRKQMDLNRLNEMAEVIVGIHDFSTFAAAGDKSKSKVREIFSAHFYREGERIIFQIAGNAFLWRMVRSLTGSFLYYCDKGEEAARIKEILEAKDRSMAGPTAPARGLFLTKVFYGSENFLR